MLYPKEDRGDSARLFYVCRNCDHQEESRDSCVYEHNIIPKPIERKHLVLGIASDPALPRTNKRPCPRCQHTEVVFFQTQDMHRDAPMSLTFVCCSAACNHMWTDIRKSTAAALS